MGVADRTRERIRRAAAELVAQVGASNWTLAGVAETAGISKGGLLYHYPSKQALLEDMLQQLLERRTEALGTDNTDHASMLTALVESNFSMPERDRVMAQAIIAASAENPELLAPARANVEALFRSLARPAAQASQARTIMLASEGLQLLEMLGLLTLSKSERQQLRKHLKAMAGALQ